MTKPSTALPSGWVPARVDSVVHGHLASDLSLTRMADEVGLSTHHFAQGFKANVGTTPHRYVQHRRLEAAAAALQRDEHQPIADIAFEHGFASQAHMTDLMRRPLDKRLGNSVGAAERSASSAMSTPILLGSGTSRLRRDVQHRQAARDHLQRRPAGRAADQGHVQQRQGPTARDAVPAAPSRARCARPSNARRQTAIPTVLQQGRSAPCRQATIARPRTARGCRRLRALGVARPRPSRHSAAPAAARGRGGSMDDAGLR